MARWWGTILVAARCSSNRDAADFCARHKWSGSVRAAALGSGGARTISSTFLVLANHDEDRTGEQRPAYRDTVAMGVVPGAAWFASTAPGAVLQYRDRSGPGVQSAAVGDQGILVGLGGAF
jgi:hypothetical protein